MAQGGDEVAGCGCMLILLPMFGAGLLLVYGVFVLVMRAAFGIELPNPVDWLPPEWAEYIPTSR